MFWIMAFRSKRTRSWWLVTAVAWLLVCGAVLPAAAEDGLSASDTVKRVYTRVFTGDGFDTCHAPSLQAMSAWWKHSPYRALASSKRISVTSFLKSSGSVAKSVTPHSHSSKPIAPVMICSTRPA